MTPPSCQVAGLHLAAAGFPHPSCWVRQGLGDLDLGFGFGSNWDPPNRTPYKRPWWSQPIRSHLGVGAFTAHFRTHFSGDWDVHWGYDLDVDPWPNDGLFCWHTL